MRDLKEFADHTKEVLSVEEARAIDRNIRAVGASELELMENAGTAVANFMSGKIGNGKNILVVCGSGNNGGDGFVAARLLAPKHNVTVALMGQKESVKASETVTNLNLLVQNKRIKLIENAQHDIERLAKDSDGIIVAIFGVGFHGRIPQDIAEAIRSINRSGKKVFAVDVPSGFGLISDKKNAVKADFTITFHKMKDILIGNPNAGKVVVANIGMPIEAELLAGPGDIYLASRPRGMYASKADNGRVIIIGGSENFHGAPTLASNAAYATLCALRSGIGYAFTFVPKSVVGPVRSLSPNIIVKPLSGDNLNSADLKMLKEAVKRADSIAIGPGIGREEESLKASANLIAYLIGLGKRVVVDADALHAISLIHKKLGKNVLLTPNGHEFSLFYEKKLDQSDLSARIKAAIKVATELDTNLLLKGHETVVTDGEDLKIAVSHTSTLATMGTGDVLTGLIAGFAARNQNMVKAAVAGAYVQALIGDELYQKKGNHILATDIIEFIPSAIKEFDKNTN